MGAWKTVQQLKCLLNKREDQSSDLQKNHTNRRGHLES